MRKKSSNFSYGSAQLEKVLRRINIPRGQVTLFKALYEAEDQFIPREELIESIRWGDPKSFTGVLAALSGRVNETEGFKEDRPGYEALIEVRQIDGKESMRLRPEAREAMNRVEKLQEAFDKTMEELLEGIEVEPKGPSLVDLEGKGGSRTWEPDTPEDQLLFTYWEEIGGTIIAEVPTGNSGPARWPEGSNPRRIDGVRFRSKGREEICPPSAFTTKQVKKVVQGRHVEVIEVKQSLNRTVIGQAVAGRELFRRDYNPSSVEPVVVCGSEDPALSWACRQNGIRVEIFSEPDEG